MHVPGGFASQAGEENRLYLLQVNGKINFPDSSNDSNNISKTSHKCQGKPVGLEKSQLVLLLFKAASEGPSALPGGVTSFGKVGFAEASHKASIPEEQVLQQDVRAHFQHSASKQESFCLRTCLETPFHVVNQAIQR